jgi:hypothetical protein
MYECAPEVPQPKALKLEQEDPPLFTRLPPGDHVIRFYPDRDAEGRARIIKCVRMHHELPITQFRGVSCWEDHRVNRLMDELRKAGIDRICSRPPWRWKALQTRLACVHFFESSNPEAGLRGRTCILTLNRHEVYAIQNFIANLPSESKRKLFDPNLPAIGFHIKVPKSRPKSKSNITVGLAETSGFLTLPRPRLISSSRKTTCPFAGLDKVFSYDGNKLTEYDWEQFRDKVQPYLDNIRRPKLTLEQVLKDFEGFAVNYYA